MPAALMFNETKRALLCGEISLEDDDIRVMLLMESTTVPDQNVGVTRLSHFTNLDEYDDASYSRQALSAKAVAINSTLNRAYFSSANVAFGSLEAGARDVVGALFYKHVDGTAANDIPLFYVPANNAIGGDGTSFTMTCPTIGWILYA